jgi:hypothetical protein
VRADALAGVQRAELVEAPSQLRRVLGDRDVPGLGEALGRGELMVVAVLAEGGHARHDQHGLAQLEGAQDGAHPGVRDDHVRRAHPLAALGRGDEGLEVDVPRLVLAGPDLREDLALAAGRPGVHGLDETVERELRPDGHEDHSTDPR